MFNHWFAQEAIPGNITKGVITLLNKGGRHVWKDLDDYRPITLPNTELKILVWILANSLQRSDWTGAELRCEGKIEPRQFASGSRDPREVKRRHKSCTDQFRSVQGLREGGPSVLGNGFGDCWIRFCFLGISLGPKLEA